MQADLSSFWAHMSEGGFSHVEVYIEKHCRSKFIAGVRNVSCFHCSSSKNSVKPKLLCLSVFPMDNYFRIMFSRLITCILLLEYSFCTG